MVYSAGMEYYGWEAIARRLGYCKQTVMNWTLTRSFPVLIRRPPCSVRKGGWLKLAYTNDELITRWELAQFQQQREERLARREAKARARADRLLDRSSGQVVGPVADASCLDNRQRVAASDNKLLCQPEPSASV